MSDPLEDIPTQEELLADPNSWIHEWLAEEGYEDEEDSSS